MHYARRPLIGSASGGVYRHGTRTSTKIRPDHGSALRGPDKYVSCTNVSGTRASFIGQMPVSDVRHQSREHGKNVADGKTGNFTPRSIYRDGGSYGGKGPAQSQTPAINTFNRKCLICGSRYHLKANS